MMTPYLPLISFWTNEIQALQHRWKKRVNRLEDYVEKYILFGHISWEYLGHRVNFSVNPHGVCVCVCECVCVHIYIYIYI